MSFDSTTVFYRNFKLTDKGVKCGVSCSLQIGKGLHCLPSCQMITKSCEASCFRNLYDYSSHKINTNPQHLSPRKSWDFRSEHRISAVFAALFWVLCIGLVYLPEWLRQTGLDTAQIGLVLASATWLKIPVTLIAGNLADRIGRRKKVLLMIAVAAALLFPLLLVVRGYLGLCLLWACIGALISTMVPITDSISVTAVRREGLTYGRMRMWGSLGFLVASVFGGMIIRHFGSDSVVWLLSIGAVVLLVSVAMIPDYETRQPMQKGLLMMLPVFKIPGFVVFLLVAALLMASHAALYSLATVRWVEAGIGLPMVGLLWAIGVVAEIFIFFISARVIARWNPWQLLLIAGVVGVVRWPLMAVVVDVNLLFGIQTMHAITFTFTQLAVVSFIERQVPEELTSSAQTVYDSCALGLIFGGALYISGLLSTVDMAFGFWAMAVMSGVGALVAFSVVRRG